MFTGHGIDVHDGPEWAFTIVRNMQLAQTAVNGANTTGNGLLFGEFALFKAHLIGLVVAIAFTFAGALLILKITDLFSPLTVSDEEQHIGSDMNQHGEKMHSLDLFSKQEAD
jgi:Amt family ammonium transporter